MRKLIFILILMLFYTIFSGCSHTIDKLSRFNTGNVDAKDIADAMVADEQDFREALW
ncbi:MAG: hypothetical protein PHY46_00335 [Candidatus Omnitrophica bacterium]|nr:hypothetical protein [Candidatus Omnitrophota bacterium]